MDGTIQRSRTSCRYGGTHTMSSFESITRSLNAQVSALSAALEEPGRFGHFPQKLLQDTRGVIQKAVNDIIALNSRPAELPVFLAELNRARPVSNSRLYEAYVDTVVSAFLGHYFPVSHHFLVHPQWTYNLPIVDPRTIQTLADLSIYAQPPGEYSEDSAGSDNLEPPLDNIESDDDLAPFDEATGGVPLDYTREDVSFGEVGGTSTPPRINHPLPSTTDDRMWEHVPRGQGVGAEQSLTSNVGIDFHERAVPAGPGRLTIKRPDFIVSRDRKVLLIVEDKLYSRTAAIGQLAKYMKDFRTDFPAIIGMIGRLGETGIEVAFYHWKNQTDQEPAALQSPQGEMWLDVDDKFVRSTWLSVFDSAMTDGNQ
ncbi:hypothetical protein MSAN_00231900 [Mycena sanguinolenta]|uniref:Uncharacterized protein n=1 Tax=Mycena sanguinolenta TaxID=230812 RepID=A0A8H6ZHV3_9AGAR|nr:hypothetical protein MSAN_00231900 [Mycena sanguinolenta]